MSTEVSCAEPVLVSAVCFYVVHAVGMLCRLRVGCASRDPRLPCMTLPHAQCTMYNVPFFFPFALPHVLAQLVTTARGRSIASSSNQLSGDDAGTLSSLSRSLHMLATIHTLPLQPLRQCRPPGDEFVGCESWKRRCRHWPLCCPAHTCFFALALAPQPA